MCVHRLEDWLPVDIRNERKQRKRKSEAKLNVIVIALKCANVDHKKIFKGFSKSIQHKKQKK